MISKIKPKSEFSRNVLVLMTGTTIAQAIPIAISPILTRIYRPEDFGILALFVAITSIFGSIANGRYELAIMLPKKDEDAINIFALGFIITLCISLVLLTLVVSFNSFFTKLLGSEDMGFWLYFVPISVFFMGVFNILNYFNNRKKYYIDLRNATIFKSIVLAIVQLSAGFIKQGVIGLISGQIFSQLVVNISLLRNILKDKILISKISKTKIFALTKRYKKFPKFSMPSEILNNSSVQLPILLLSSFFNTAIVGFYSLSHRLISMPMVLIGGSIGQVFFQQASIIKNDKLSLANLTLKTYFKLLYIGIIPFSIIAAFGDYIFAFIFGEQWIISGEFAQVLSLWILFVFISSPISNLTSILEKQKEGLYFNFFILCSRIGVILFGAMILQDAHQTIFLYGLTGFLFWFFWSLYLLKIASVSIVPVVIKSTVIILSTMGFFLLVRVNL